MSTAKRQEVHTKSDLVDTLASAIREQLGIKISKDKAWRLFKLCMNVAFSLAAVKALSLSGVGRFSVLTSQRSVQKNKPALRMRFKASQRVNNVLNAGGDFLAVEVVEPETPAETPAEKPEAPPEEVEL